MLRLSLISTMMCLTASVSFAQDAPVRAGSLEITAPAIRAPMPGAPAVGGYLTIRNTGSEDDRLTGGSAAFAERVEVHEMALEGDVMKMRALPGGLPVPAGQTVVLKPGSYHLMFLGLSTPPRAGDIVPVTLNLEHAGQVTINMAVVPAAHMPKH